MPEWLDFRLTKADCAFREFPKLRYLSLFYLVSVVLVAIFYMPILKFAYSFNFLGNYPFQNLIAENIGWLSWGRFIAPVALTLFFYWDILDRHDEMYLKKYHQLPKWVK